MGLLTTVVRSVPPLRQMFFPAFGNSWGMLPGLPDEMDYRSLIGDGSGSNLVEAAVRWMKRSYVQAPLVLREYTAEDDDVGKLIRRHAMLEHLRWPTKNAFAGLPRGYFSGKTLAKGLIASYLVDGNATALKVRSEAGKHVQTWYCPHNWLEPMWSSEPDAPFISHYEYRPDGFGKAIQVRVQDVIHIRDGIDPKNTRKGCSGLKTLLRELYTDEKAARFSAAMLHNLGIPGVVISPEGEGEITEEQANEAKSAYKAKFGGDRIGEPLVMRGATKVHQFGFSPKDLDISSIRDVPEERLAAVFGIPAAVLGFGTGLHQVKVGATMNALRDEAWQNAMIPLLLTFAEELAVQLLPEFEQGEKLERLEVEYDLSRVPVMSEWWQGQADLWTTLSDASMAKRSEVRRRFGLPVTPEDDVYVIRGGPPAEDPRAKPKPKPNDEDPGEGEEGDEADSETDNEPTRPTDRQLPPREAKVAGYVAKGRTNKEIAHALGVTERTVERAISRAMSALGASSRAELASLVTARA